MSLSESKHWTTSFESSFHVPCSTKVVSTPHTSQGYPRMSQHCKERSTHEGGISANHDALTCLGLLTQNLASTLRIGLTSSFCK